MTDTKNALTKLSANLAMYRDFHKDEDRVNDHILTKAKRIVAELAKVRDTNWLVGHNYPEPNSSSVAVSNCRAIAEEGDEDGK